MSDQTFRNIFEGKQSVLEERLNVDPVLLSKLQQYGIITNIQRTAIEVTFLLFARLTVNRKHFTQPRNWPTNIPISVK